MYKIFKVIKVKILVWIIVFEWVFFVVDVIVNLWVWLVVDVLMLKKGWMDGFICDILFMFVELKVILVCLFCDGKVKLSFLVFCWYSFVKCLLVVILE